MNVAEAIQRSSLLQPEIRDKTETLYRVAVAARMLYEEATAIRTQFGDNDAFTEVDALVYPAALLEAARVRYAAVVSLIEAFDATQAAVDEALEISEAE